MPSKKIKGSRELSADQLAEIAKLFKILSEPARLQLISGLMSGSKTVSELVMSTGLKQGNVSKHLKILFDADLLAREKEGNFARYRVSEPMLFELCQLVCTQVGSAAENKLKRLTPTARYSTQE